MQRFFTWLIRDSDTTGIFVFIILEFFTYVAAHGILTAFDVKDPVRDYVAQGVFFAFTGVLLLALTLIVKKNERDDVRKDSPMKPKRKRSRKNKKEQK